MLGQFSCYFCSIVFKIFTLIWAVLAFCCHWKKLDKRAHHEMLEFTKRSNCFGCHISWNNVFWPNVSAALRIKIKIVFVLKNLTKFKKLFLLFWNNTQKQHKQKVLLPIMPIHFWRFFEPEQIVAFSAIANISAFKISKWPKASSFWPP